MNRCLTRAFLRPMLVPLALVACLATALLPTTANAQDLPQRIPPMAATAKRGVLVVTAPPEILLDGKAARLSPGSRIRGPNNLLVLSGSIVGQALQVSYVLDPLGLVHEVWILTEAELRLRK